MIFAIWLHFEVCLVLNNIFLCSFIMNNSVNKFIQYLFVLCLQSCNQFLCFHSHFMSLSSTLFLHCWSLFQMNLMLSFLSQISSAKLLSSYQNKRSWWLETKQFTWWTVLSYWTEIYCESFSQIETANSQLHYEKKYLNNFMLIYHF